MNNVVRKTVMALGLVLVVQPAAGQRFEDRALPRSAQATEARVWLDRAASPIVDETEEVRLYYRSNFDAFAAVVRIDARGRAHLVHPQHPALTGAVDADRDYRLMYSDRSLWRGRGTEGEGYFFILASAVPLDVWRFDYLDEEGWDLGSLGERSYVDPYEAIDEWVEVLLPDWETTPFALDLLSYEVRGRR